MRRTGGFTFGLVNGQLGRTYQNGHPGVTTMWIGLLSQGPDGALRFADRVHGLRFVGQVPGYMEGLAQARIGFAVLGALAAAGSALLALRLFGLGPARADGPGAGRRAVPGGEPAARPRRRAAGGVHDAGGAGGAGAVARPAAASGSLLLAGVATGLALLSKTPALFLVGVRAAGGASGARAHGARRRPLRRGRSRRRGGAGWPRSRCVRSRGLPRSGRRLLDLAVWGAVALADVRRALAGPLGARPGRGAGADRRLHPRDRRPARRGRQLLLRAGRRRSRAVLLPRLDAVPAEPVRDARAGAGGRAGLAGRPAKSGRGPAGCWCSCSASA